MFQRYATCTCMDVKPVCIYQIYYVAIDDPTLLSGSGCGQYKMYLSQKETVKLPFKYLRQMNSDQQMTTANGHHNRKATIKVYTLLIILSY